MSSLEQSQFPLEQANRPNSNKIDLKIWREAKDLSELGKIINPQDDNSISKVYSDLLFFEQPAEKKQDERQAQVLCTKAHGNP